MVMIIKTVIMEIMKAAVVSNQFTKGLNFIVIMIIKSTIYSFNNNNDSGNIYKK